MDIQVISLILGIGLKLFGIYFIVIALFNFLNKNEASDFINVKHKFAIVIAARNEEKVIGELIKSIKLQNYPKSLYDIFVVPNNCTDGTEETAKSFGANIIHSVHKIKNKGEALKEAFRQLNGKDYDCYLVFDADNILDPNYLLETNKVFSRGAKIVKGRHTAKNPYDTWVSGCYDIYFNFFNLFFNRPRSLAGLSAKLIGTGFAVHKDVLAYLGGFNTETIAEDAEFASQCACAGFRVYWEPKSICYDEEPVKFKESLVQRKRWCSGLLEVSKLQLPKLFNCKPTALIFDMIMFLIMPFVQVISVIPFLISISSAIITHNHSFIILSVIMLAVYYIALTFIAALLCRMNGRDMLKISKAIILFPIFMASWLPLQILAFFHKTTKWEQISHTKSLALSQIES